MEGSGNEGGPLFAGESFYACRHCGRTTPERYAAVFKGGGDYAVCFPCMRRESPYFLRTLHETETEDERKYWANNTRKVVEKAV